MRPLVKLAGYVLLSALVVLAFYPLWIGRIPSDYFSALVGKSKLVDNLVCEFSEKVRGESMDPLLPPGTSVRMTRCFEENDLTASTLVLYKDNSVFRFGIIRYVLPLDPVVYKISDEKAPELLVDVTRGEIAGISRAVDSGSTRFRAEENVEDFILKADEYLTEFYLGKIPRGSGVEAASVVKTNTFSRRDDKFCMVIVPRITLTGVETKIVNTITDEDIVRGADIVFDASKTPNTNCDDFGQEEGMLNLEPGSYRYRFLYKHQALADIPFTVK